MNNFDLKNYLIENKLTFNSRLIKEIELDSGNDRDFLKGINPRDEKQFNIITSIEARGEKGFNVEDSLRVKILDNNYILHPTDVYTEDDIAYVNYESEDSIFDNYKFVFMGPIQGGSEEKGNLEYLVMDVAFNYMGPK